MNSNFNLQKLAIKKANNTRLLKQNAALPRHKSMEKFLKGPIPLKWLQKAGTLPGKAAQVGNAL